MSFKKDACSHGVLDVCVCACVCVCFTERSAFKVTDPLQAVYAKGVDQAF